MPHIRCFYFHGAIPKEDVSHAFQFIDYHSGALIDEKKYTSKDEKVLLSNLTRLNNTDTTTCMVIVTGRTVASTTFSIHQKSDDGNNIRDNNGGEWGRRHCAEQGLYSEADKG